MKRFQTGLKKGYTLVELMVVVSIVVLIASFGVPSITYSNHANDLRAKGNEIQAVFQQVHTLAVNPSDVSVTSYRLDYIYDSDIFALVSCAPTADDSVCGTKKTIQSVRLLSDQSSNLVNASGDGHPSWFVRCDTAKRSGTVSCVENTTPDVSIGNDSSYYFNHVVISDSKISRSVNLKITKPWFVVTLDNVM